MLLQELKDILFYFFFDIGIDIQVIVTDIFQEFHIRGSHMYVTVRDEKVTK